MSDLCRRICLVGGNGLIGKAFIKASIGCENIRLVALSRREFSLPDAARMEIIVADSDGWHEAIIQIAPNVVVCALGTTRAKTGGDEAAFRAIDHDFVVQIAKSAKDAGARHFILISSIGANANAQNFYLRVKGEVEAAVSKLGIARVDIIQPGLLRGKREERRIWECLAMQISPLFNLLLFGKYRQYRAISAAMVAKAIIGLTREKAAGKFFHTYDSIIRAANRVS